MCAEKCLRQVNSALAIQRWCGFALLPILALVLSPLWDNRITSECFPCTGCFEQTAVAAGAAVGGFKHITAVSALLYIPVLRTLL